MNMNTLVEWTRQNGMVWLVIESWILASVLLAVIWVAVSMYKIKQ